MKTWITDDNGNRCSVEHFGSEEKAREALASLINCSGCSNCSNCSGCSDCSRCSGKDGEALQVPVIPEIHKRIYERVSQPEALDMDEWHVCETTHCRAGWVVHEAGKAGYALEKKFGTALAAQLIYRESGYQISPVRFRDSEEDAMADMKRLAEAE